MLNARLATHYHAGAAILLARSAYRPATHRLAQLSAYSRETRQGRQHTAVALQRQALQPSTSSMPRALLELLIGLPSPDALGRGNSAVS